jgi:hypothetical protein
LDLMVTQGEMCGGLWYQRVGEDESRSRRLVSRCQAMLEDLGDVGFTVPSHGCIYFTCVEGHFLRACPGRLCVSGLGTEAICR